MAEIYGGGNRKKYISPGKVRKQIKKMKKSYKIADEIKETEQRRKEKEIELADLELDRTLEEIENLV